MVARQVFVMLGSVAVVMLCGDAAEAQVATVIPNYSAGVGGAPPKCRPSGTYSTPAGNDVWQIVTDYGTFNAGAFQRWAGPNQIILQAAAGTTANWARATDDFLVNPPANLYVRAQLQKNGVTQYSAYHTVP